MAYDGEDRRDPERFVFPKWFMPVVTATIIGAGGVAYTAHNRILTNTQTIEYLVNSVRELREENKQVRADLERHKEKNERFYNELLYGVDELLMRKRRRVDSNE